MCFVVEQDYRHVVRPVLTSLSQSTESMFSVQSTVGLQSPAVTNQQIGSDGPFLPGNPAVMTKATAPSCDSGVETGGVGEIQDVSSLDTTCVVVETPEVASNDANVTDSKCDKAFISVVVELTTDQSVANGSLSAEQVVANKTEMCSTEMLSQTIVGSDKTLSSVSNSAVRLNSQHSQYINRRRWGSTDVLRNVGNVDYGTDDHKTDLQSGLPNRGRRWVSEYALNSAAVNELVSTVQMSSTAEKKVDDGSSIVSNGSDIKSGFR